MNCTYDTRGNLTGFAGWTHTYDSKNRLLSASSNIQNSESKITLAYDFRNRAVSRTINGVTTYFVWDDWSLIEERDASGTLIQKYIQGPGIDNLLAKTNGTGTVYYHQDGLGSTVALTDASGAVVENYTYDAFGAPTVSDVSGLPVPVSGFENRFLFTGREYLAEVGLYDYRNRAYDPELGRFLQTDPIRFDAGDGNLYRYVANRPADLRDPTGFKSVRTDAKRCTDGFHVWLEWPGGSAGFYPNTGDELLGGIYAVISGKVKGRIQSPDPIRGSKKCRAILLDECLDKDKFMTCIKESGESVPPNYGLCQKNCEDWVTDRVLHCKKEAKK